MLSAGWRSDWGLKPSKLWSMPGSTTRAEYKVPDGPVYLPWTSQQVNLPIRERPSRYFMAIFDVGSFLNLTKDRDCLKRARFLRSIRGRTG